MCVYLYIYIDTHTYITYFVDWSEEVQSTETAVTVTE